MRQTLLLLGIAGVVAAAQDDRSPGRDATISEDNIVVQRAATRPTLSWRSDDGDPDLEPGFPVLAPHTAGSFHAGPAIHTLIGNIDGDAEAEILTTGLATGPILAWNHDGTSVQGWPVSPLPQAAYLTLGELTLPELSLGKRLEVLSGHWGKLLALRGNGTVLTGWPQGVPKYVATPGTLADVDGDGVDEIFVEEEDGRLHGYRANGKPLPGWPVYDPHGGQERHTPAVADLTGDGDLEILTVTGAVTGGSWLLGYNADGTTVPGFPLNIPAGYADTFPVVGDVDGDGELEIVTLTFGGTPSVTQVQVRSADGALERTLNASRGVFYGTAPALADLDGDGHPEIIVQTNGALDVWKGDGSVFPGWPRIWSSSEWLGNSSPVVGDVTGDGLPDIVVTSQVAGDSVNGSVRVYDRHGNLHPSFPKLLPIGAGAVPAIADIDLDGRNEIVVTGSFWNGIPGMYPKVWAYDLGGGQHGSIEWGQFMGGPRHQGRYITP